MVALLAILLCCLPGAIVAATPIPGLSRLGRLGLAIASTPLVLGTFLIIVRSMGGRFADAHLPLMILAAVGLVMLAWSMRTAAGRAAPLVPTVILIALLIAGVLTVFLSSPAFRSYSAHGLMHAEIVYALDHPTFPPTEPGMHGERLTYPWFGEATIALIASTCDIAPTRAMNIVNLVMLVATALLLLEIGAKLRLPRPWRFALVGIALVGTNLGGLIAFGLIDPTLDYPAFLSDRRSTTVLRKFFAARFGKEHVQRYQAHRFDTIRAAIKAFESRQEVAGGGKSDTTGNSGPDQQSS